MGKTTFNISEKTSKGWNSRARAEDYRTIVESFYKIKVSINSRNLAHFYNEQQIDRNQRTVNNVFEFLSNLEVVGSSYREKRTSTVSCYPFAQYKLIRKRKKGVLDFENSILKNAHV